MSYAVAAGVAAVGGAGATVPASPARIGPLALGAVGGPSRYFGVIWSSLTIVEKCERMRSSVGSSSGVQWTAMRS